MKLPLITKLPCGSRFHVLQFEEDMAYGVDESTHKVCKYNIDDLTALTEQEYFDYKKTLPSENVELTRPETKSQDYAKP